jgi:hypothetical protein
MRPLLVAAVAAAALAGCGSDATGPAELAAAKCTSAVHHDLGLRDGETVRTDDVAFEGDDDERRLTGRWEAADAGSGDFDCVVVPDESDDLRGLRVTELEVRRTQEPA